MRVRSGSGVILVVLGLVMMCGAARAQDGTPVTLPTGLPVTPDPSECTVEPMALEDLIALVGTPSADAGTSDAVGAATPEAFALPEGEPADQATVDEITATVRTVLACFNAGNFLAFFALSSENMILADLEEEGLNEETIGFLGATPEVTSEANWTTLVGVREVTMLPDGRVGALIDTIFPDEMPDVQTDYITFVEEDGTWLLDEIVEDLEGQFPPTSGTPVA
jgi:hypothetical protein